MQTLQDVVKQWYSYLKNERQYSAHTLRAYQSDLISFFDFQNHHRGEAVTLSVLEKLEVRDFRAWLAHRQRSAMSNKATARAVSTIRSFYKYIEKQEIIKNHAVFSVSSPKVTKSVPRALSSTDAVDAGSAIGQLSDEDWVSKRDMALLTLIYGCGLRISEALSLTITDLPIGESLKITGKGNKEREVPVLPIVRDRINEYVDACPFNMNESIFIGVRGGSLTPEVFRRQLKNLRCMLGLPDSATPHAFRHSFATHLLEKGVGLREIQELLGHSSLASTQIYTKVDTKNLLEAFEKAHPKG
ncbi:MAG: tyrosine recombinase XerC [Rickettsiales bacterium]|nr:tyrosine recombinase XerC [Pseudomonadota bacterium]MDA0965992.1 tyrosine recombinase XerC [Pseudomonadota bacterium]MDG4542537.1 tyrosine recombinase XerC [Rickettsiales bacterium]MDG4545041.1 tyrosine recombinase XerC [Rickettsiales bacterium]MDG4547164.1 tyrosine recombinase XerC [Rickettsiales bacterium]